jgi:hypothetical protein
MTAGKYLLCLVIQQCLETFVDDAFQAHPPTSLTERLPRVHVTSDFMAFAFRTGSYPPRDLRNMHRTLAGVIF